MGGDHLTIYFNGSEAARTLSTFRQRHVLSPRRAGGQAWFSRRMAFLPKGGHGCFSASLTFSRSASARRAPTPWGRCWRRAASWRRSLRGRSARPPRVSPSTLHGSLAFTGKGHGTDNAIALGAVSGEAPDGLHPDPEWRTILAALHAAPKTLAGDRASRMWRSTPSPDLHLRLRPPPLPGHANGLVFRALDVGSALASCRADLLFGGRGLRGNEPRACAPRAGGYRRPPTTGHWDVPYPFAHASDMLAIGDA